MTSIAEIQEDKGHNTKEQNKPTSDCETSRRESAAARTVQRTYRGHRDRRQLGGLTLDPSTRWIEV